MGDRLAAPAFNVTRNVRLLYAFSFIGNFQLWFGIWII